MPDRKKRKAASSLPKMCLGKPSVTVKAPSGKPGMELKVNSVVLVYRARWLQWHTKNGTHTEIC